MPDRYRIRWAIVQRPVNGRYLIRSRMCVAERKTKWFGWWPLTDGDWRDSEVDAERDIERDRDLRSPLPETKYA